MMKEEALAEKGKELLTKLIKNWKENAKIALNFG